MKRLILLISIVFFIGLSSYAQKLIGYGGELSVLSFKPNVRMWVSKTTGFEVFGGIASEFDYKPDDFEAGIKYLHTIIYNRTNRTYIGIVGKWNWIKGNDPSYKTNLPVGGIFIGREWFNKRVIRKGFAVELGYQYGVKEYDILNPVNQFVIGHDTFNAFPLILNLRYSFYRKK
jgi:hypothetical protein